LSHYDENGNVSMVEVSEKSDTLRTASAQAFIELSDKIIRLIKENGLKKGNPLEIARIAGIMAAKKTQDLIPLCHQLMLTKVDVQTELKDNGVQLISVVSCIGKTGVEMEALTAVSVAALTIYDMCKAVDKRMTIGNIGLLTKSGGKSGDFVR